MSKVIAKNRSGWILHEYLNVREEQISEYPNVTGAFAKGVLNRIHSAKELA